MPNIVEFRLVVDLANKDNWVFLGKKEMPAVPKTGIIINIDGNPFIIYNISFAIGTGDDPDPNSYTYVYVFKAGSYKLKIAGMSV